MNKSHQLTVLNFEHSINELCKRKLKLLQEVDQINQEIKFLREQQELV
jgi:hypothetical protein